MQKITNLALDQDFYPESLRNQVFNEMENSDPQNLKGYMKKKTHKKGSLSCLVQYFKADQVESMISSPSKKIKSSQTQQTADDSFSTFTKLNLTHVCKNSMISKPRKSCDSLLAFKMHPITSNKVSQANYSQKLNIQLLKRTFQNKNPQNDPHKNLDSSKIKSTKEKLEKIRKQVKLKSSKNFVAKKYPNQMMKQGNTNSPQSKILVQLMNPQNQTTACIDPNSKRRSSIKTCSKTQLSISDFEQIKCLGSGVYGEVSLFRHKESNFIVAIKKILKRNIPIEDSVYLIRQIKTQSFADHPNIVKLYTFFDDSTYIYLVMEACNEGNLFSNLQSNGGKMTEERVKKYIRHICKAVEFLHNNSIIHRDLKPQNILINNGVAKLCDFGWAIQTPELRNSLCGTPLYSCPQVVKNQQYDRKIDIWSIGIMTYELIFGFVPFDIRSKDDLYKVVDTDFFYPQNIEISKECQSFIDGCLKKDPHERYEIQQLLRHAFIKDQDKIRDSLKVSGIQSTN